MGNTNVTLASQYCKVLSAEEVRQTGFTHAFTIPYTTISAVSGGVTTDTVTVTLGTTPARFLIDRATWDVTTAFTTTATGTLTAGLGTSSQVATFLAAKDMLTAGPGTTTTLAATTYASGTSAVSLVSRFTTGTAGAPSDVATGSVTLFIRMIDLAALE